MSEFAHNPIPEEIAQALAPLGQEHGDFVNSLKGNDLAIYNLSKDNGRLTWKLIEAKNGLLVAEDRREVAEQEARTDYLTGLPNEREIDSTIDETIANNEPFGVIEFDLDNFKAINDDHGHDAGDHVLQEFARLMKNTLRSSDILGLIGRKSGDEFWAVVRLNKGFRREESKDMTPVERLQHVITRMVNACDEMIADHPEWQKLGFGVSMGSAMWTPGTEVSVEKLKKDADDALRANKKENHEKSGINYR